MLGAPARQIKFKIHVHNKIYNVLIAKIKNVLVTSQVYDPTQYLSMFPKFWKIMITKAIMDITK
jgi:hypothetical protein